MRQAMDVIALGELLIDFTENGRNLPTPLPDWSLRARVALCFLTALLLTACGSPSGEAAYGPLPDEAYEAVPYSLYPAPENAYVGDVMPFVTGEGTLEFYYLYDTDQNGQGYHPIYKYETRDLCGYEDRGRMLDYGQMSDPDPALGTGSVVQDSEGLYHLFYTGHNDMGNGGKGKECVMHALSADRESWTKDEEPLFFAPEGYEKDDFRDPEVFWVEEEQCYWLLMAARERTRGAEVVRYTSPDLREWTFAGPLFSSLSQYMLECPDLFRMGDTWYLTYSWDCVTYYAVGDSMYGPFVPPRDNTLDGRGLAGGNGFIFYAAKTAELDGAVYLCGWIGRPGLSEDSGIYQWTGNVMVHQLVRHEEGTLGVKAPERYADYFTADRTVSAAPLTEGVTAQDDAIHLAATEGDYALADLGTRPPAMMLECEMTLEEGGRAGFGFGRSGEGGTYTALCLDAGRDLLHYEGYEISDLARYDPMAVTEFDFTEGQTHHVTLVCENEIVVLYIDDSKALSSRIRHSVDGAHLAVFADGCDARIEHLRIRTP